MRLAGQSKAGYFPCPPDAVAVALKQLRLVDPSAPLVDPCAGQGAAIKQVADGLTAAGDSVHVIELDEGRAAKLRQALPDSFSTVRIYMSCSSIDLRIHKLGVAPQIQSRVFQ